MLAKVTRPFRSSPVMMAAAVLAAFVGGAALAPTLPALSADAKMSREEVYKDIEKTIGAVPTFFKQLPDSAVAGACRLTKSTMPSVSTRCLVLGQKPTLTLCCAVFMRVTRIRRRRRRSAC